jgi:hypothetical protein
MDKPKALVLAEPIEQRIYLIRGQKVLLDSDLAALYGVSTSRLTNRFAGTANASRPTSCSSCAGRSTRV